MRASRGRTHLPKRSRRFKRRRILLIDDHPGVRSHVAGLLRARFTSSHVRESASGMDALAQLAQTSWDLVICDLDLPDVSGLDVLERARAADPTLPFMIFSGRPKNQYAPIAVRQGAAAYVMKTASSRELLQAVAKALSIRSARCDESGGGGRSRVGGQTANPPRRSRRTT